MTPVLLSRAVALAVATVLITALPALAQVIRVPPPGAPAPRRSGGLTYGTGSWEPDSLGNHRAVVRVEAGGDALYVRIPWRRRDATPERVGLVMIDAQTQQRVRNVARLEITREYGDLVFQPASGPGDYHVYYLPYTGTFTSNYPKITYRPPEETADRAWMQRNGLTPQQARLRQYRTLPAASVTGFDAIDDFSRFTPMEYIASPTELDSLRARYAWAEYFLFPEDRSLSIRMTDDIPRRWAQQGPFRAFAGRAQRGEFYTFQIGLWAHRIAIDSLRYEATPFTRRGGTEVIPASAITAFNLEGVDWSGRRFTRPLRVERGKVQALWFGVDIPANAVPGEYEGDIAIGSSNARERVTRVVLTVGAEQVADRGDDDPANLSRLRWLNSQLAADDGLVPPYTPMTVAGTTVGVLGRSLTFGVDGFPVSIRSFFTDGNTRIGTVPSEILAAPLQLTVEDSGGAALHWRGGAATIGTRAPGAVGWSATRTAGALAMQVRARMEFEGTTEYAVTLRASERTALGDVRLEIPMRPEAARYMMGLGQKGGRRPASFRWSWDVTQKNQDAAWLGGVSAGLQFTLKDEHYVRPLNTNFYLSKPLVLPRSWGNGGAGGCTIDEEAGAGGAAPAAARVLVRCHSGARVLAPGDSLRFDFRLMITPFKPLDTAGQWGTRFFHAFVPIDSIARRGANTVNVHHANRVNPWINYPFLETAQMRAYIDSAHARAMKVKIYYTVRELTNHAPELFALRSLGDEVLSRGPGGGFSWLQEHLGSDYLAAWHVPAIKDAAVVNSGVSRWHNFYVEGLDWLVRHVKIDGLYIDDVAFDRTTMKRVRKVLDRGNPGALIDLHSANQYNPRDGFASSANLYLEHFPFLNRLWLGEYFDYGSASDYWLVEISGIPFGLMGEMLEKGGHPWRGMTMGMTARLPWSGDPAPLWQVWDRFGIRQSRMRGWWEARPPVTTGDSLVLATTWTRPGRAMIALGSWAEADRTIRLSIDWQALGLDPARVRLRAPAIDQFQGARSWGANEAVTVPGGKGLLLLVEPRP